MSLEALANELLLELFEYLDAIDRFRAFHNLNSRFNGLLLTNFRQYRVNFHLVLKYRSDIICKQYFPSIIDRITSFCLSNKDNESELQTKFFFSSGLLVNKLTNVRSLSLCYINVEQTIRMIIIDCQQLNHLIHLKIVKCHQEYMNSVDFSNTLWSLPHLTHCCLNMQGKFSFPKMVSTTLKYLSISSNNISYYGWQSPQILDILQRTPYLQHLNIPCNDFYYKNSQEFPLAPFMTILKLSDVRSYQTMMNILRMMPNLTDLKIDTNNIDCDGYKWEQLIENYLPKLKVFRLRMSVDVQGKKNNERDMNRLVDSFRSQFWLEKHQWYIQCHLRSQNNNMVIILHTMSDGFSDFHLNMLNEVYKTTCPHNSNHNLYYSVKNLSYTSFSCLDRLSFIQFSNIHSLSIDLKHNMYLWENVPIFDQLTSITVFSTDKNAQLHLQLLLDRSPNLYSLIIKSWPSSQVPLIKNKNKNLRRIDLSLDNQQQKSQYFGNEECQIFIQSSLAKQCEELFIKVENLENALRILSDGSLIIINDSGHSKKGFPAHSVYATSKAAVRSFARCLSVDLKDRQIRVNIISSAGIETPLAKKFAGDTDEAWLTASKKYSDIIVLGRIGQPDKIAKPAVFLASDDWH